MGEEEERGSDSCGDLREACESSSRRLTPVLLCRSCH